MQWRSRRAAAACAPAERSHSRAPHDTLSVAGPSTAPPRDQRGVIIGKQTRPCRSRRHRGVRGPTVGRARRGRARVAAPRAAYPPQGPRARSAKMQDKCAARPTVQRCDLWRQLAPSVCAHFGPRSIERQLRRCRNLWPLRPLDGQPGFLSSAESRATKRRWRSPQIKSTPQSA
jgi:hypothetical protein